MDNCPRSGLRGLEVDGLGEGIKERNNGSLTWTPPLFNTEDDDGGIQRDSLCTKLRASVLLPKSSFTRGSIGKKVAPWKQSLANSLRACTL